MKYNATHKDQPIHSVTLAGKEYKAKDGTIEVPEDHVDAHKEAAATGLVAAAADPHEHTSHTTEKATDDHNSGTSMSHGRRSK